MRTIAPSDDWMGEREKRREGEEEGGDGEVSARSLREKEDSWKEEVAHCFTRIHLTDRRRILSALLVIQRPSDMLVPISVGPGRHHEAENDREGFHEDELRMTRSR